MQNNSQSNSLEYAIERICYRVRSLSYFYARFHIAFCSFLSLQFLFFLLFFPSFSHSTFSPFVLAFFFLTLFSYFVLFFFFQTKKTEQLLTFQEEFSLFCKIKYANQLDRAKATHRSAHALEREEISIYKTKTPFKGLNPVIEKCKNKLHWKIFFEMKEILLKNGVMEIVSLIKKSPMDLEPHKILAESYTELALLYILKSKVFLWVPSAYLSESMQKQFLFSSQKAVEEYKILQIYGETSSWIHTKLAQIYHLQGNIKGEVQEQEELLLLDPHHEGALARLGILYFEQGNQAKGLEIYARLQEVSLETSSEIIKFYDLHHQNLFS